MALVMHLVTPSQGTQNEVFFAAVCPVSAINLHGHAYLLLWMALRQSRALPQQANTHTTGTLLRILLNGVVPASC